MPGDENVNLEQIVNGLIARDDTAWMTFLGMLGPIIDSACRKAGLNADEREDIAQIAVVKLLERDSKVLRKLDITTSDSFFGWLKVVVTRTVLDFVRRKGNRDRQEFTWAVDHWRNAVEGEGFGDGIEQGVIIEKAVSMLNESEKTLFRLDYNGLKDKEIADILGIKLGTLQQRLSRLRHKIRSSLMGGEGVK